MEGVERAGADVAEHHADGAQRQAKEGRTTRMARAFGSLGLSLSLRQGDDGVHGARLMRRTA